MKWVTVYSPAKVNLFLAVTGCREDGFHSLVSLAAQLQFGDTLWVSRAEDAADDILECPQPEVPTGTDNLILQAARLFRDYSGVHGPAFRFQLKKRIPLAAGLGGGSSNAVSALRALEALTGWRATPEQRREMAARLGSDCPLFLERGPVLMRGRGEHTVALGREAAERLRRYKVLVVKPPFGVDTAWAYGEFSRRGVAFSSEGRAEARIADWVAGTMETARLLGNDFEQTVPRKFLALDLILNKLRAIEGLHCVLSGSGSAFFCLAENGALLDRAAEVVRESLGDSSSCIRTAFSST